ncbi:hypothetical protein EDD86DRAFT_276673 [Gorgonomyces haynaldii]|nr:hypothetical protein EDD86DRAFT_276673 [Gorgonomyces haynaldii]
MFFDFVEPTEQAPVTEPTQESQVSEEQQGTEQQQKPSGSIFSWSTWTKTIQETSEKVVQIYKDDLNDLVQMTSNMVDKEKGIVGNLDRFVGTVDTLVDPLFNSIEKGISNIYKNEYIQKMDKNLDVAEEFVEQRISDLGSHIKQLVVGKDVTQTKDYQDFVNSFDFDAQMQKQVLLLQDPLVQQDARQDDRSCILGTILDFSWDSDDESVDSNVQNKPSDKVVSADANQIQEADQTKEAGKTQEVNQTEDADKMEDSQQAEDADKAEDEITNEIKPSSEETQEAEIGNTELTDKILNERAISDLEG